MDTTSEPLVPLEAWSDETCCIKLWLGLSVGSESLEPIIARRDSVSLYDKKGGGTEARAPGL